MIPHILYATFAFWLFVEGFRAGIESGWAGTPKLDMLRMILFLVASAMFIHMVSR